MKLRMDPAIRLTAEVQAERGSAKISGQPLVKFDAAKKSAEIFLFAAIGDPYDGVTAKAFGESFAKIGAVDEITVYINSPGGDVWQGNTIYNLLKGHKAKKVVHIVGLAASIASIIAMAGDEIKIAKNGFFFIHDAAATAFRLNAAKMRRTADELDLVSEEMAATYARRSGQDPVEMRKMMRKEVLLNAAKSVELGLADSFMEPVPVEAVMTHLVALKGDHEEVVKEIETELSAETEQHPDADGKDSNDSSESVVKDPSEDGEAVASAEPSADELKARRDRLGLAFYATERSLREIAEREKR